MLFQGLPTPAPGGLLPMGARWQQGVSSTATSGVTAPSTCQQCLLARCCAALMAVGETKALAKRGRLKMRKGARTALKAMARGSHDEEAELYHILRWWHMELGCSWHRLLL